jgi:hypothetical protein
MVFFVCDSIWCLIPLKSIVALQFGQVNELSFKSIVALQFGQVNELSSLAPATARFPPAPSGSRYPLPGLPVFLAT